MKKYYVNENHHKENLFIATALISASMVIVIQLINQNTDSIKLEIALYCFAISIPLLVGSIAAMYLEKSYKIRASIWYLRICNFFGCSLSIVGIGAVFFNFNILLGVFFSITSVCVFFIIGAYSSLLPRINNISEEDDDENEVE